MHKQIKIIGMMFALLVWLVPNQIVSAGDAEIRVARRAAFRACNR